MGNDPGSHSVEIFSHRQGSFLFKAFAVVGLCGALGSTVLSSGSGWRGLIVPGVALVVYAFAWADGAYAKRLGIGVLLGCAAIWSMALARAAPAVLTRNAVFDPENAAPWIVIPALVSTAAAVAAARLSALLPANPVHEIRRATTLMRLARMPSAFVVLLTVGNTFAAGWWAAGAFLALAATWGAIAGFLYGKHLVTLVVDVSHGGPSERWVVRALLLLALTLRVAAIIGVDIDLRQRPHYRPGPDGVIYHNGAQLIVAGQINIFHKEGGVLWYYNPGPTLFYAAWYASFGDRYLPVGLAQALLGAGGC